MNHYGIPAAIKAFYLSWRQMSRSTKRTSEMLDGLKDGDCVIVPGSRYMNHVKCMAREKGLNIHVEVVCPKTLEVRNLRAKPGNYHFDHSFIEEYYHYELEGMEKRIEMLNKYINRHQDNVACENWQGPTL